LIFIIKLIILPNSKMTVEYVYKKYYFQGDTKGDTVIYLTMYKFIINSIPKR